MKILEKIVPVDNQTFPFVSCFTSYLLAISKSTVPMEQLRKKHQNLYRLYMPVTGCGVGCLWNPENPTMDTCYCTGDNYLDYAMQFAGYNYITIKNNHNNCSEFELLIKETIDQGQPLMAQGLIGSTWSLITGYEEDMKTLYGYHQREWGIEKNPADSHLQDGTFVKTNWYDTINQIVICKEKKKEKLSSSDVIAHFIDVLKKESANGCVVGQPAFQKCIDILEDDAFYKNISDQELLKIYTSVFYFCASFAEARVFSGSTVETSEFKKKINASLEVMGHLNQASAPLRNSHKVVYEIWAVIGKDYNFEPDKYMKRLKDQSVRKQLIELVKKLRENDIEVLRYFEQCL